MQSKSERDSKLQPIEEFMDRYGFDQLLSAASSEKKLYVGLLNSLKKVGPNLSLLKYFIMQLDHYVEQLPPSTSVSANKTDHLRKVQEKINTIRPTVDEIWNDNGVFRAIRASALAARSMPFIQEIDRILDDWFIDETAQKYPEASKIRKTLLVVIKTLKESVGSMLPDPTVGIYIENIKKGELLSAGKSVEIDLSASAATPDSISDHHIQIVTTYFADQIKSASDPTAYCAFLQEQTAKIQACREEQQTNTNEYWQASFEEEIEAILTNITHMGGEQTNPAVFDILKANPSAIKAIHDLAGILTTMMPSNVSSKGDDWDDVVQNFIKTAPMLSRWFYFIYKALEQKGFQLPLLKQPTLLLLEKGNFSVLGKKLNTENNMMMDKEFKNRLQDIVSERLVTGKEPKETSKNEINSRVSNVRSPGG